MCALDCHGFLRNLAMTRARCALDCHGFLRNLAMTRVQCALDCHGFLRNLAITGAVCTGLQWGEWDGRSRLGGRDDFWRCRMTWDEAGGDLWRCRMTCGDAGWDRKSTRLN